MRRLLLALVILTSCKRVGLSERYREDFAWEGVPQGRICDFEQGYSSRPLSGGGTCLSEGHIYACVVDRDAMKVVCQRAQTDVECTKIVNVETVCTPGK